MQLCHGVKAGVGGGVPGDGGEDRAHGVGQVAPRGLVVAEVLDHLGAVPANTSDRGQGQQAYFIKRPPRKKSVR